MDELLRWRKEFPPLENTTYLVSHSLGAMPRTVEEELREFSTTWTTRASRAWEEGWWEMAIATGDLIAPLIGAGRGEVSLHLNDTLSQAIVLSALDFTPPRDKLIFTDLDFPSETYLYYGWRRYGARPHLVQSRDGITIPLEGLLAAIDEETRLVATSHVLFKSGASQDIQAIAQRAHAVGALVLVDAYQSVGSVPVDVRGWEVDFLVGGSIKWLCGGPGVAFLYVKPKLMEELEPAITGWMAHPRPFDFELGPIRYRPDAWRFLNGTPNVPGLYTARAGFKIINQVGVPAIREKSVRQTSRLITLAREFGFEVHSPLSPEGRGGMIVINPPHAQAVYRELLRREILVDYRPEAGIRIGPHFYNEDEEVVGAMKEMQKILETKAYEKYL